MQTIGFVYRGYGLSGAGVDACEAGSALLVLLGRVATQRDQRIIRQDNPCNYCNPRSGAMLPCKGCSRL